MCRVLIIGELINGSRTVVKQAVVEHDETVIRDLAVQQVEAGADYIDVNISVGQGDKEAEDMVWAIKLIEEVTTVPLAVDSANLQVMEAGLRARKNTVLVNSVSAEKHRMEPFLDLCAEYNAAAAALPIKDSGIPPAPEERLEICQLLAEKARDRNIPVENMYFDPLVLPLGVDTYNSYAAIETIKKLKKTIPGVKTTAGISNVSYGLPGRKLLNQVFLVLCMQAGLDGAILDPTDQGLMAAVKTTEVLLNKDKMCMNYLQAYRKGLLNN
ncbi:MAG: dihydropteroate synthase [Clostridiales bacterium]|nr:dihydropteroate synthase [Clostridiales bacterium]MCF8023244.1 dihydropteroate synthase [Clostridiales bacterium]